MNAGTFANTLLAVAGLLALPAGRAQQMEARPAVSLPRAQEPAPAPVTPAAVKGPVDPDYVIGAGDTLEVNVFNEPKFSGQLPVRPDGMISITLVGDMPASGYTPMQLGQEITTRLRKLITDPSVTVSVLAINSKRVYLVGEVGKVGPLSMTPGMTPLQAIATAGGPGPYANVKKIYILRANGAKQLKIPFNYRKAIRDGDMQGVTLMNGDTIVIP